VTRKWLDYKQSYSYMTGGWLLARYSLVLRAVRRDGSINGSLSSSAVRDIVRRYGRAIGVPDLAPHDLRRTMAKLSREGGAPMETIQKTLGHASLRTTEIYTATGEEANAGDFLRLEGAK